MMKFVNKLLLYQGPLQLVLAWQWPRSSWLSNRNNFTQNEAIASCYLRLFGQFLRILKLSQIMEMMFTQTFSQQIYNSNYTRTVLTIKNNISCNISSKKQFRQCEEVHLLACYFRYFHIQEKTMISNVILMEFLFASIIVQILCVFLKLHGDFHISTRHIKAVSCPQTFSWKLS